MQDISQLPNELWLIILELCRDESSVQSSCTTLVILGNLCMTNRRLRDLIRPMLVEAIHVLMADKEDKAQKPGWMPAPFSLPLLLEFLHAVRQCPMLVQYVRQVPTTLTVLNRQYARGYHQTTSLNGPFYGGTLACKRHARFGELQPFGQKALRSLGVTDPIRDWHSFDGWIALLLLMLPQLEHIAWRGDGTVGPASPLRRIAHIAKAQAPQKSFRALKSVSFDCFGPTMPDALTWDFLALPSVEAIIGPANARTGT